MARLSYYAPGVYVEEVPSARQPIAGVGTSTAGFIGIIPDHIYIPVPNSEYDPVLTNDLLEYARLSAQAPSKDPTVEDRRKKDLSDMQADLQARLQVLDAEIKALTDQKPDQDKAVETAEADLANANNEQGKLDAAATPQQTTDAARAVRTAQKRATTVKTEASNSATLLAQKQVDRKEIGEKLEAAKAGTSADADAGSGPVGVSRVSGTGGTDGPDAGAGAETEIDDYVGADPPPAMLQKSVLRPYYLVPFKVGVDEFATKLCTNFSEYANLFGDFSAFGRTASGRIAPLCPGHHLLTHALNGFFTNGGTRAFVARVRGVEGLAKALERFKSIDDVAILATPGLPKVTDVWEALESYVEEDVHQNVFAVLDAPGVVNDGQSNDFDIQQMQYESLNNVLPRKSTHAAFYFPNIEVSDPAKRLQDNDPAWRVAPKYRGRTYVSPSGHVAGIYARTDEERGVHKAPANATVRGALEVKYYVSKPKQEMLNPQGVNCIRLMNGDVTLWGARTIGGDRNGEWKYVSVRRFAGFLEASIDQGTQWVVFEPNDPKLWSKIILNITSFLTNVWRSGALFGLTPQEAFYVKCDAELNPPEVRDLGQVVTEIGVSIVRPAEFVIFRISQSTGEQKG